MKYFKFFCFAYSICFAIGFSIGWKYCSKNYDDHLIKNVRMTVNHIDSSKTGVFLVYVNDDDTLIRYSVDSNKIVDVSEWEYRTALGVNKPKFPFLSEFGSVKSFFFDATVVSAGAYFLSKVPKTPTTLFKYLKELDTKLKIENSDQRIKYAIAGILGSVSGFISGYFLAEKVFSPSENSEETQKRINDTRFWEKAKLRMWDSYAEYLQNRLVPTPVTTEEIHSRFAQIETTRELIVRKVYMEKYSINSKDFDMLHVHEKNIHRMNSSDIKTFQGSEAEPTWLDYINYCLVFAINGITLTWVGIYFYELYKNRT